MNKLKPVQDYTASEISEAVSFSPALAGSLQHFHSKNSSQVQPPLLQQRNMHWAQSALATILDVHTPREVCFAWSETAFALLKEVFDTYFSSGGAALFALGKLGSAELNLSSDVDLLFVVEAEDERHVKSLRQFQKMLTERGPFGFMFRVDLDLRPGGRQGPILPTLDHLVDYYGNYGETWERMAFVRLAPVAGDPSLIAEVQAFAKKFTYRKHLDYTLLDDLKNMRGKIRQHYAVHSNGNTWDLKLGVGGIRDVELFTHALQVIHGGKNPALQGTSTEDSLRRFSEARVLPSEDSEFLIQHYWRLRHLENFIQATNDEQTHLLPKQFSLPSWAQNFVSNLDQDLAKCDRIVSTLLGTPSPVADVDVKLTGGAELIWQEILGMEAQSRSKERDEQARLLFLHQFYETLLRQKGNLEKALHHLRDFIKSTRAKASFFTLLVRNKSLLEEIAWLFGHSPYLSQILSSRPELIDSFVYRSQVLQKEDLALLLEQLVEKRLLGELISGSHFLEDHDIAILQANLSEAADEITRTLLEELKKEYPSDMNMLCLGKWGGCELGLRSDLDFIFVTPGEPNEADSKLARRMINRLTELRKGGSIYAIDMRLKPSGKAGPMVISYIQLAHYLQNEAEAWEHQAYLKARWLLPSDLKIQPLYLGRGVSEEQMEKLELIRKELVKTSDSVIDLKYVEGGMLDIELFSQVCVLETSSSFEGTSTENFLSKIGSAAELKRHYLRMRQIEQMWQLLSSEGGSKLLLNHESFQQLAKSFQLTTESLVAELQSLLSDNRAILNQLDPRRKKTVLSSI